MDCDKIKLQALQIIDENLKLDDLLEETHSSVDVCHLPASDIDNENLALASLEDYVDLYAKTFDTDLKLAVNNVFVQHLHKISSPSCYVLKGFEKKYFTIFCKLAFPHLDGSKVLNGVCDNKHSLPLDVLNILVENNIVSFKKYIKLMIERRTLLSEFITALQETSLLGETVQASADVIHHIVFLCDETTNDKTLEKVAHYILHKVIKNYLDKQVKKSAESSLFELILTSPEENMRKCFSHQVVLWITNHPEFKVSDVLEQQIEWRTAKLPPNFIISMKKILQVIGVEPSIVVLKKTLSTKEVNWKNLLILVSCLVHINDASTYLQDMIRMEIASGLSSLHLDSLVTGILLARQASLEGSHLFPNYSTFFKECFSSSPLPPPQYRFLLKFLTEIVPCEDATFLQTQVLKPPQPQNEVCRKLLRDYLDLARTRLADMKPVSSNDERRKEKLKHVEKVVKLFEQSGKIPPMLTKMCLFQKVYFHEEFLPTLLEPHPLPDEEDGKMKLISILVEQGKIGKLVYEKYKRECKAKSDKLIQDLMEVDEEDAFMSFDKKLLNLKSLIQSYFASNEDNDRITQVHCCITNLLEDMGIPLHCCHVTDNIVDLRSHDSDVLSSLQRLDVIVKTIFEALVMMSQTITKSKILVTMINTFGDFPVLRFHLSRRSMKNFQSCCFDGLALFIVGTTLASDWSVSYIPLESELMLRNSCKTAQLHTSVAKEITVGLGEAIISSLPFYSSLNNLKNAAKFQNVLVQHAHNLDVCGKLSKILGIINCNLDFVRLHLSCIGELKDPTQCKRPKLESSDDFANLLQETTNVHKLLQKIIKPGEFFQIVEFAMRDMLMKTDESTEETNRYLDDLYCKVMFSGTTKLCDLEICINLYFNNWRHLRFCQGRRNFFNYFCNNLMLLVNSLHPPCGQWFVEVLVKRLEEITFLCQDGKASVYFYTTQCLEDCCNFLLHLPQEFVNELTECDEAMKVFLAKFLSPVFWLGFSKSQSDIPKQTAEKLFLGYMETDNGQNSSFCELLFQYPLLVLVMLIFWTNLPRFQFTLLQRNPNCHKKFAILTDINRWKEESFVASSEDFNVENWTLLFTSYVCQAVYSNCDVTNARSSLLFLTGTNKESAIYFFVSLIYVHAIKHQVNWNNYESENFMKLFQLSVSLLTPGGFVSSLQILESNNFNMFPKVENKVSSLASLLSCANVPDEFFGHPDLLQVILRFSTELKHENCCSEDWNNVLTKVASTSSSHSLKQSLQDKNLDATSRSILKTEAFRRTRW